MKVEDRSGAKFGMLTVLSRAENDRFGRTQWNVVCECGTQTIVALFRMTRGHTRSCGCIGRKGNIKHGMQNSPTYNSWCAMKARCNNPFSEHYQNYGGRGISVCSEWDASFEAFVADMGERPKGMSIERINSDGNYEPSNCKWATRDEQSRNRRSTILVDYEGERLCIKDWSNRIGINPDRIYGRIRRGMSPSAAIEWAMKCEK